MKTNGITHAAGHVQPLDVSRLLSGARLVVLGGTGFLGKIFWVMLLHRYPEIGKIFLLVRSSKELTSEQRFWSQIATAETLSPLRERHGAGFEAFLREKVVPIDGEMGEPLCGVSEAMVAALKGTVSAVVNVAGVVDFNPPLDESLQSNAFGPQNLVALARALGDAPVLHTSTCYVSGESQGLVYEADPRSRPFPRCDELGVDLWDPEREIAECLDLIAQARHRCDDAFRESEFLERAKANLEHRGEPAYGRALESELATVKRKFVSERLVEAGLDRATHWGWPNIYTYTKSIGEQVVARSGLRNTIVRPAICESTVRFPFPGWNEGFGTSAALIFLALNGVFELPSRDVAVDVIPGDLVCTGMIMALSELIEGTHRPLYQLASSDLNPTTTARLAELTGLYKRRYFQRRTKGNPLFNRLMARIEFLPLDPDTVRRFGPAGRARAEKAAADLFKSLSKLPGGAGLGELSRALDGLAKREGKVGEILEIFRPFTSDQRGPFSCANTRAAFARLTPEDKEKLPWDPEAIDWGHYWLELHLPAIETRVLPMMEKRYKKELKPIRAHETLVSMVRALAKRHEHAPALQRMEDDGLSRVSYRDLERRAAAVAARLHARGLAKGDRVVLGGQNDPDWAIAYFGVLTAGGVAVPVDAALDDVGLANIVRESGAKLALWDSVVEAKGGAGARARQPELVVLDLHEVTEIEHGAAPPSAAEVEIEEDDLASIIFTSGTTGHPKGVKLTHANFASLVAALAPIFPLRAGDRVLSVLPLHHTFEFTCGLLLPLSRGARVAYVGEITGERVSRALTQVRATAMVGVPALWQLLERRILSQVEARGPLAKAAFSLGTELNRVLAKNVGIDAGKLLFGQVHEVLGGRMKYLISGGAALPPETYDTFAGLGLKLTEGYGLTEAAPVLTVARPSGKGSPGKVGKPVPGVEVRIDQPDERGVGEIVARGPNVMAGYTDDAATRQTIDEDGWLHTGDLGKFDRHGNLEIVGRLKEVIITTSGENVYPDDVEKRIGAVPHVAELAIVGVEAKSGGERIACLAVPEADEAVDRAERHARASRALRTALNELPFHMRPAVVHLVDAPLPRTSTRKVRRSEVARILARLVLATARPEDGEAGTSAVRAAVAALKGVAASELGTATTLAADLGFDSLMMTELLAALEAKYGPIDPAALQACQTVGDVEALVHAEKKESRTKKIERGEERVVLPSPVQELGKRLIGFAQDAFYGQAMQVDVTGRAFIPHNRNTIVAANHASHLDMGLVRHALGTYGEDIVTLAAQDYFFEARPLRRAFLENFTNLKALDRKGTLRQSERQAMEVLHEGKTMLIFPEGTRSADGEIHEFKPLVGYLALNQGVDVLPVWLGGTREALPRGSVLVPRRRDLKARIGLPLRVADLRRLTAGMNRADAYREVARLTREAVLALKGGRVLDLSRVTGREPVVEEVHPLVSLFQELEQKFLPDAVKKPISYYFTLGGDALAKWTVVVDGQRCEIKQGKPEGGSADCVLKTSPELFTRIVRESWVPGPAEFLSGQVKSNDVSLLQTFQKVFQLG